MPYPAAKRLQRSPAALCIYAAKRRRTMLFFFCLKRVQLHVYLLHSRVERRGGFELQGACKKQEYVSRIEMRRIACAME